MALHELRRQRVWRRCWRRSCRRRCCGEFRRLAVELNHVVKLQRNWILSMKICKSKLVHVYHNVSIHSRSAGCQRRGKQFRRGCSPSRSSDLPSTMAHHYSSGSWHPSAASHCRHHIAPGSGAAAPHHHRRSLADQGCTIRSSGTSTKSVG